MNVKRLFIAITLFSVFVISSDLFACFGRRCGRRTVRSCNTGHCRTTTYRAPTYHKPTYHQNRFNFVAAPDPNGSSGGNRRDWHFRNPLSVAFDQRALQISAQSVLNRNPFARGFPIDPRDPIISDSLGFGVGTSAGSYSGITQGGPWQFTINGHRFLTSDREIFRRGNVGWGDVNRIWFWSPSRKRWVRGWRRSGRQLYFGYPGELGGFFLDWSTGWSHASLHWFNGSRFNHHTRFRDYPPSFARSRSTQFRSPVGGFFQLPTQFGQGQFGHGQIGQYGGSFASNGFGSRPVSYDPSSRGIASAQQFGSPALHYPQSVSSTPASIQIAVNFNRGQPSNCLGTLVGKKAWQGHYCSYAMLSNAHCFRDQWGNLGRNYVSWIDGGPLGRLDFQNIWVTDQYRSHQRVGHDTAVVTFRGACNATTSSQIYPIAAGNSNWGGHAFSQNEPLYGSFRWNGVLPLRYSRDIGWGQVDLVTVNGAVVRRGDSGGVVRNSRGEIVGIIAAGHTSVTRTHGGFTQTYQQNSQNWDGSNRIAIASGGLQAARNWLYSNFGGVGDLSVSQYGRQGFAGLNYGVQRQQGGHIFQTQSGFQGWAGGSRGQVLDYRGLPVGTSFAPTATQTSTTQQPVQTTQASQPVVPAVTQTAPTQTAPTQTTPTQTTPTQTTPVVQASPSLTAPPAQGVFDPSSRTIAMPFSPTAQPQGPFNFQPATGF